MYVYIYIKKCKYTFFQTATTSLNNVHNKHVAFSICPSKIVAIIDWGRVNSVNCDGFAFTFPIFLPHLFKIHDFNWRTRGKLAKTIFSRKACQPMSISTLEKGSEPPQHKSRNSLRRPDGFPICSVKFTQPCGHHWEMVQQNAALNVAVGCYHITEMG